MVVRVRGTDSTFKWQPSAETFSDDFLGLDVRPGTIQPVGHNCF